MKINRRSSIYFSLLLIFFSPLSCFGEINPKQVFSYADQELLNQAKEIPKGLLQNPKECQPSKIIKAKRKSADYDASIDLCLDQLRSAAYVADSKKQWNKLADICNKIIELRNYQNNVPQHTGGISGIGVQLEIDKNSNLILIKQVVPGSPASLAGIKVDDALLSVDSLSIANPSNTDLKRIVNFIRGPKGTSVTIRLRRSDREWNQIMVRRPINLYVKEYANLYRAYYMLDDLAKAAEIYPFLYNNFRAEYGEHSEELAFHMASHANLLFHSGVKLKGLSLLREAIAIYERTPKVNQQVLMILYGKASFFLNNLSRPIEAMNYEDKAIEILKENSELLTSINASELTSSLGTMAYYCRMNFLNSHKCEQYAAIEFDIANRLLRESDIAYQTALSDFADSILAYRSLSEAIILYEKLIKIKETNSSTDPASTLTTINLVASLLQGSGNNFEAEGYYLKASKLASDAFGNTSIEYLKAQDGLTSFYRIAGMQVEADLIANDLYMRALSLRTTDPKSDQFRLIAYKSKLLSLIHRKRRIDAKVVANKAIELADRYPNDHVAQFIGHQVKAYYAIVFERNLIKSVQDFEEIIRSLDPLGKSSKVHNTIEQEKESSQEILAMLYAISGDYPRAIKIASNLLDNTRKKGRVYQNMIPFKLQKLAQFQIGLRKFDLAEHSLASAIDEARKINSPMDLLSFTYLHVANLAAIKGQSSKAELYYDKFTTGYIAGIFTGLWYTPKQLRTRLASPRPEELDSIFQYNGASSDYHRSALFARLNFQGIIADIEQRQSELMPSNSESNDIIRRLEQAYRHASASGIRPEEREQQMRAIAVLENNLFKHLPALRYAPTQVAEVANVLSNGSVLIEFQKYGFFPSKERVYFADQKKYQYVAFVLNQSGNVQRFDLGPAEIIDRAIARATHASSERLADLQYRWADVAKLIIWPLRSAIPKGGELYLSPDSELNRVPFSALPAPSGLGLLSEYVRLRILTSGRDLLVLSRPVEFQPKQSLVIGNPSFDQEQFNIDRQQESMQRASSIHPNLNSQASSWPSLPATVKEGSAIAALLNTTLIQANQATPRFVQSSPRAKIIHIASHGYFTGEQPINAAMPGSSIGNLLGLVSVPSNLGGYVSNYVNPLLKSGIVLAGANQPSTNSNDDGYLTALEISQLQWKGTEMVVVSACESGKGDIQTGEGLFGLRRAIAVAGARSSLLSLWKVDDKATAEFMVRFYKRLKAGEPRSDALAAVQKEFRDGKTGIPGWSDPFYWAAWQLVGDWRPIKGL